MAKNSPTESAVTAENLSKTFGSFQAVKNVSFQVKKGEIFGFLGPNGAGKSTTIRMLCGILTPSSGKGIVAGYDITKQPEKVKEHIGYMSQRFSLYNDLTVEENIDFFSGIYGIDRQKKKERKEWVLAMAGLKEHRRSLTSELPSGWKQRLALGCAVLHEPPILFLDEPTSGVDPISRRRFWDLIYELSSKGITVFVTTHYMDEAEYCDRLGMIYGGKLIATGTPHWLKSKYMPEGILEILCDQPQKALNAILNLSEVQDAALFGNAIHVSAASIDNAIGIIKRELSLRQVTVQNISKISPSLEDIFIYLTENNKANAERRL